MKNKIVLISLALSLILHLILGVLIELISKDNKNYLGPLESSQSKMISIAFGPSRWKNISPKDIGGQKRPLNLYGLQAKPFGGEEPVNVQKSRKKTHIRINKTAKALDKMGISIDTIQNLQALNFDVQFIAPKDLLQQDEHNSPDKKFYSFFWRSYLTYVSRIISTYQTMQLTKPVIKRIIMMEKHELRAKVVFDKKGDIIFLQMIELSPNKYVQELFEQSLEKIQIPNPPSELLGRDETFTFHYVLKIN